MEVVYILFWCSFAASAMIEAYFDAKKWTKIEHSLSFILRFLAALTISISLFGISWLTPIVMASFGFVYWIVFNTSINYFRGLTWSYIGNSEFIDRNLRKMGLDWGLIYLIKIFLAGSSFIACLILIQ